MKHTAQLLLMVAALTTAEIGVAGADASTITWQWTGTVTGHTDAPVGLRLDTVVPLGTRIDVMVTLDPDAPFRDPSKCLQGSASASFQVVGKTYTHSGFVWQDGQGFGGGRCDPSTHEVEIVVPSWAEGGPALSDGWVPYISDNGFLPGLWWAGDLASGQPASINSQFPYFYFRTQSIPQRFTANLQAVPVQPTPVPEPSTWLLTSTGLSVAAAWRRRRQ